MLNVMLADDEALIREGFADLIDWKTLGFEVVSKVEDGEQALAVMEQKHIDVLFTDIRMPFLDGLELAAIVSKKYPDTYIVFISGYEEFEYAREAVRLGAFDYILKPIGVENIHDVLGKIRANYDEKNAHKNLILDLHEKVRKSEPLIAQQFARKLVQGKISGGEIERDAQAAGIDPQKRAVGVLLVQIDHYYGAIANLSPDEIFLMQMSFESRVNDCANAAIVLHDHENECVLCVIDSWENAKAECMAIGKALIEQFDDHSVCVAVGSVYRGLENAARSYEEAQRAINYKFIDSGQRLLSFDRINKRCQQQTAWDKIAIDYDQIAKCIEDGLKAEMDQYLNKLLFELEKNAMVSYLLMNMLISNIYMYAIGVVARIQGSAEKVLDDPVGRFQKILSRDTAAGMMEELRSILFSLIDYTNALREGNGEAFVLKAKRFVEKNFCRSDLTLSQAAGVANMSTNYFCLAFRQLTGMTFSNYVMDLRMQKAKELLETTDKKIYEVSEEVGYETTTYFSTIFKRKYGVSPVDCRKS